jgi:antitoxin component of MazEF toxin-antitoxin module
MIKTLTKHGNSYALVIDKPILDLLKIGPNTPLEVTTDGRKLSIEPADDPKRAAKFAAALAKANKRYGRALKKLAE